MTHASLDLALFVCIFTSVSLHVPFSPPHPPFISLLSIFSSAANDWMSVYHSVHLLKLCYAVWDILSLLVTIAILLALQSGMVVNATCVLRCPYLLCNAHYSPACVCLSTSSMVCSTTMLIIFPSLQLFRFDTTTDTRVLVVLLWYHYHMYVSVLIFFFFFFFSSFFSDRQPCRSDLQPGWCHKSSRPVEVFCRAPQLGRHISTLCHAKSAPCGHVSWRLSVYIGQDWRTWSGVWSVCQYSHREVSEMPILFRWALRPQCSVCRQKIAICWAVPVSKLGQGVPGIHRFLSSSFHCTESGEVSWPLCRWQGSVSAEPDCRFSQVCLLFRFLSVPHEQAPTGGILKTVDLFMCSSWLLVWFCN